MVDKVKMALLIDREIDFLDSAKDQILPYIENNLVGDWLIKCTKNRVNQRNYISEFKKFFPCIQTKMLKLSTTTATEFTLQRNFRKTIKGEIELPPIINLEHIMQAIFVGYDDLKPLLDELANEHEINTEDINQFYQLAILTVLVIIARANLERRFTDV